MITKQLSPLWLLVLAIALVAYSCKKEELVPEEEIIYASPCCESVVTPIPFVEGSISDANADDQFTLAFTESKSFGDYSEITNFVLLNPVDKVKCHIDLMDNQRPNSFALAPDKKKFIFSLNSQLVLYENCSAIPEFINVKDAYHLAWINNTEIVYVENIYTDDGLDLWIAKVNTATGLVTPLLKRDDLPLNNWINSLLVSYDQQHLAFSADGLMWTMGIDGSNLQELPFACSRGVWSPYSNELLCNVQEYDIDCHNNNGIRVCVSHGLAKSEILLYDLASNTLETLDTTTFYRNKLTWDLNQEEVYFIQTVDNCRYFYSLNLKTKEKKKLHCQIRYVATAGVASTDQQLYFSDLSYLYKMDKDGNNMEEIFRFTDLSDDLKWYMND